LRRTTTGDASTLAAIPPGDWPVLRIAACASPASPGLESTLVRLFPRFAGFDCPDDSRVYRLVEFFALWVRAVMADLEGNHPLADAQYRELLTLWHQTEDRIFAVPGVVSAAGFHADQRDRVNLAACCWIVGVIAQENRNDETRAGIKQYWRNPLDTMVI
jgi:hypothetical protein